VTRICTTLGQTFRVRASIDSFMRSSASPGCAARCANTFGASTERSKSAVANRNELSRQGINLIIFSFLLARDSLRTSSRLELIEGTIGREERLETCQN